VLVVYVWCWDACFALGLISSRCLLACFAQSIVVVVLSRLSCLLLLLGKSKIDTITRERRTDGFSDDQSRFELSGIMY